MLFFLQVLWASESNFGRFGRFGPIFFARKDLTRMLELESQGALCTPAGAPGAGRARDRRVLGGGW